MVDTRYITRKKRLDDSERTKVLDLANHGIRGAEISRLLDRSPTAVYRVLREYGVPVSPRNRTTVQIRVAHAMLRHGDTLATKAAPTPRTPPETESTHGQLSEYDCIECNAKWTMSESHLAWFVERELTPPKRCAACRALRRGTHDNDRVPGLDLGEAWEGQAVESMLRDIRRRLAETMLLIDTVLDGDPETRIGG